jgi:excisionase family DNA binding protein
MSTTPAPAAFEALWTANQAAAYLQASVSFVYKAAERGDIPCRRLGALLRFVPEQVRAWAEGAPANAASILPFKK